MVTYNLNRTKNPVEMSLEVIYFKYHLVCSDVHHCKRIQSFFLIISYIMEIEPNDKTLSRPSLEHSLNGCKIK